MKEQIISFLVGLPKEMVIFILAMLPISELRGAIPYGIYNKLPFLRVLIISIAGNLIPVIPLYFLLNHLLLFISRFKYGKRFSDWLKRSTLKRSKVIEIYEMLGLIIFIGIPLPMTGAWTGTIASVLLKLRPRYYIIGVICGVLLAAFIVSLFVLVFQLI
ncbi:MAG TPA: small multi-drug export protein [bacterium]|nr:small multi-drug export protein [bacterium]HPP30095.1 small multi-drug export protein [bacterium]